MGFGSKFSKDTSSKGKIKASNSKVSSFSSKAKKVEYAEEDEDDEEVTTELVKKKTTSNKLSSFGSKSKKPKDEEEEVIDESEEDEEDEDEEVIVKKTHSPLSKKKEIATKKKPSFEDREEDEDEDEEEQEETEVSLKNLPSMSDEKVLTAFNNLVSHIKMVNGKTLALMYSHSLSREKNNKKFKVIVASIEKEIKRRNNVGLNKIEFED
jgi:hypothetical protein